MLGAQVYGITLRNQNPSEGQQKHKALKCTCSVMLNLFYGEASIQEEPWQSEGDAQSNYGLTWNPYRD